MCRRVLAVESTDFFFVFHLWKCVRERWCNCVDSATAYVCWSIGAKKLQTNVKSNDSVAMFEVASTFTVESLFSKMLNQY